MGVRDETGVNIPLYEDLRRKLLKEYSNLPFYASFPSEREICEKYGVSRPTVRSALERLEADGDIIRLPRKGTFFLGNKPYLDQQLSSAGGFYNIARGQGRKITSRVLFQNISLADEVVAEKLGVPVGSSVFRLERVRYLDGNLFCITDSHIPIEYLEYLRTVDFTDCSLYDTLSNYGIERYRGLQRLEIKPSDQYESFHLEVEVGTPLSVLSSLMYTKDDRLIEYVVTKSKAYMTSYEMVVYHNK